MESVRSQFPALQRVHAGQPVAYFDGPGGTQVPQSVVDAMADYLLHHNANTHWVYPTSLETDAALLDAREVYAAFFNAPGPEWVSFGQNMTTITFHVARALARQWGAGDEIIVTELDHHGNVDPWRHAAEDAGVTVRTVPLAADGVSFDMAALEALLSPRTKLLAVGAASNAIGTISDVAAAGRLAKAVGALVYVDAVHYAPHTLVDVQALGCDFLACSSYKFYGPHQGILCARPELIASLRLPKLRPAPAAPPDSLETGTQSHEGIVGAAAAVRFLASVAGPVGTGPGALRAGLVASHALLHEDASALTRQLWDGLGAIAGVTRYGRPPGTARTPTVSFTLAGHTSHDVALRLVDAGLFVSSGDFYAQTLVERLGHGEDGLVRIGCACYTTASEIDRLLGAVAAI
ncbi:cysteine desulfurase-like protein [Luteitalea sp.]|jgi:cysteine desulfurase family protein (TIGR01976 family)|uniref:cysteine desulfurase-like protein n=1 Tax=Luteitalea sp. TaxID=2004800 RepID=UPI0037CC6BD0